jgi:DNA-binding transcriptional ArsR family regulator
MSESERACALALLTRGDLVEQVRRDIEALGYVGEHTLMLLLYLIAISRKLSDPCSGIVLSGSGAGKSGATEVIEKLTPPEDVVLFTRLTPQSLYYTEPGYLDRKLVIVEERFGSIEADYSIRVLQSRKKLIAAAPVKDPQTGNMRTKVFMVEARCAFIEATTASSVNHENATRCFELQMDETEEQTRRIHERQRLMRTERGLALRQEAEAIARRHWNAQRLLEPLSVVIPFADKLSFPSSWMRTRRDHARFLNLIEVSAFLHQHQRERTSDGAIVAALADYAVAYGLAAQVLAETLADVKKPLRQAFERIRGLSAKGDGSVSRREIREALSEPDSTVRRWLGELVELEYLELEPSKGGQGRSARYRLSDRAPREELLLGLLTPEELRSKL